MDFRTSRNERRRRTIACPGTDAEYERVTEAFRQAGFVSISEGVRAVTFAYALSAEVRDMIARFWRAQATERSESTSAAPAA